MNKINEWALVIIAAIFAWVMLMTVLLGIGALNELINWIAIGWDESWK